MTGRPPAVPVHVIRLPDADPVVALPAYQTAGAAGMDVRANLPPDQRATGVSLPAGGRLAVPTGLAIALPDGFEMQIRPRSGLARQHGVTLANAPGTIDADYRGEVQVLLLNTGDAPFTVEHGMRIAQMVLAPVVRAEWLDAQTLPDSPRGRGGFGSTGL